MSAINIVKSERHKRVTLVTDGAAWRTEDGTIVAFPSKALALPHLSCVLATRGVSTTTALFGYHLGCCFNSFDEMIAGIEEAMPNMHQACMDFLGNL